MYSQLIDLCLKIKERGEKVIYQPKSCLYHLEGKSEGRQDRMSENAEHFLVFRPFGRLIRKANRRFVCFFLKSNEQHLRCCFVFGTILNSWNLKSLFSLGT